MNEAGGSFRSAMRIRLGLVTKIRRDKACLVSRSVAADQLNRHMIERTNVATNGIGVWNRRQPVIFSMI
jgi:hypothetical protein